jgi:hypothetical protein
VVPSFETIEYLVSAGVPLNTHDNRGKTPLAYWREPRDYEAHWFRAWIIERLSDEGEFRRQRDNGRGFLRCLNAQQRSYKLVRSDLLSSPLAPTLHVFSAAGHSAVR